MTQLIYGLNNTVPHMFEAPPAFDIPGKGAMKCMCYENLMKLIKEQAHIPPPQLFRCTTRHEQPQKFDRYVQLFSSPEQKAHR